ncbi:hypothetical protein [Frigoriflavimonas asaccharolytica]|uniref:Acetyltransferase (GNAT) family protein n=1 Tax=Frigoriflavimonas asaccharolytica TaxID=2735899 RepID=A0A8J8G4W7_9FLAO|nr:hypothetical protein [Frigoriflavimonas asaccharolytica]NRS91498.1 hypothetical protein [Frigoriflavimonas asaccharolytica]
MIRKVSYKDIDFQKYEKCLENSVQRNFYAKREILDFLCEAWELLIYGDYQYIMPIPIKNKFGLNIALIPLFCQQLGVYSLEKNTNVEQEFLEYFRVNYKIYLYPFNSSNSFEEQLAPKKNYIIEKTAYSSLKKRYYKGRKSAVKSAQYLNLQIVSLDANILNFINTHFKGLDKNSDKIFFQAYLEFLSAQAFLKCYAAFENDQLLSLAIVIQDDDTNYLLGLMNDPEFLNKNAASFLLDKIFEKEIANKKFSFMGGSIRGIELFFKSFGAELECFPILQNNKKQLLMSLFR